MQRPDARVFEGEIKANIGFRILAGAADRIARSMAFRDADNAPKIARGIKGRALIETDSEDATEVQLYYVAAADVPAILEEAGVPHATPFHAPSTEAGEELSPAAPNRPAPARDVRLAETIRRRARRHGRWREGDRRQTCRTFRTRRRARRCGRPGGRRVVQVGRHARSGRGGVIPAANYATSEEAERIAAPIRRAAERLSTSRGGDSLC